MTAIRAGDKSVLLVVDMQAGVVEEAWADPHIVANGARVVQRARQQGAPVNAHPTA